MQKRLYKNFISSVIVCYSPLSIMLKYNVQLFAPERIIEVVEVPVHSMLFEQGNVYFKTNDFVMSVLRALQPYLIARFNRGQRTSYYKIPPGIDPFSLVPHLKGPYPGHRVYYVVR